MVVADDFTGAADAAAPFARAGLHVVVSLGGAAGAPEAPGDGAEGGRRDGPGRVVAVTSESRALPAHEAAARVRACCAGPAALGAGTVAFKKIDSTLRGNPRAEVEAALAGWGLGRAVVAPAFPAQGRVTVGGVQRQDGVPVHETVAGADPRAPARTSRLADLFAGLPCVFVDASTDADLDRAVAAHAGPGNLWVGSGGLAAALARALGARGPGGHGPRRDGSSSAAGGRGGGPGRPTGGVLVVCGSRHPQAAAQVERLRRDGGAVVFALGSGAGAEEVGAALRGGGDVVLRMPEAPLADADLGLRALAALAAQALVWGAAAGLVLTGGDTAAAVLRATGASRVHLLGELEPGTALGSVWPGGRPVATKAGGFGDAGALIRAARAVGRRGGWA